MRSVDGSLCSLSVVTGSGYLASSVAGLAGCLTLTHIQEISEHRLTAPVHWSGPVPPATGSGATQTQNTQTANCQNAL